MATTIKTIEHVQMLFREQFKDTVRRHQSGTRKVKIEYNYRIEELDLDESDRIILTLPVGTTEPFEVDAIAEVLDRVESTVRRQPSTRREVQHLYEHESGPGTPTDDVYLAAHGTLTIQCPNRVELQSDLTVEVFGNNDSVGGMDITVDAYLYDPELIYRNLELA